jgi:hypothetical protein
MADESLSAVSGSLHLSASERPTVRAARLDRAKHVKSASTSPLNAAL